MRIYEHLGRSSPVSGDLGIEVEMEFSGTTEFDRIPGWELKRDGSLRGPSVEAVFSGPASPRIANERITRLRNWLSGKGMVPSIRTSCHVHVNCQNLTLEDVGKFASCYYIVEGLLTNFCGSDREGNLFCLRNKDAEYQSYALIRALKEKRLNAINTDSIRYSAMNLRALSVFGSLEFRAYPTKENLEGLDEWYGALLHIRDFSQTVDWEDIIPRFSSQGPEGMAEEILGPFYKTITRNMTEGSISDNLYEGMRCAQDVLNEGKPV